MGWSMQKVGLIREAVEVTVGDVTWAINHGIAVEARWQNHQIGQKGHCWSNGNGKAVDR